jgi:hypothetical protein
VAAATYICTYPKGLVNQTLSPRENATPVPCVTSSRLRSGETITMDFTITSKGNFVPTEGTATARFTRLDIFPRMVRPPVDSWFGISPSQEAKPSLEANCRCRSLSNRRPERS